MRFHESLGLYEHPARAAAWVVHPAGVGLDHLHQQPHDGTGGVELAAALALRGGEAAEEVLIDPAEEILLPVLSGPEPDPRDQVDELTESAHVEAGPGVGLREHTAKRRVVELDLVHRVVDQLADLRLLRPLTDVPPAGLRGDPEHALGGVLVPRLQQLLGRFACNPFSSKLVPERSTTLLEGILHVLQEDQPENDVLVLAGVHGAAQLVGCLPQDVLEA
jgi:hypothetical protein